MTSIINKIDLLYSDLSVSPSTTLAILLCLNKKPFEQINIDNQSLFLSTIYYKMQVTGNRQATINPQLNKESSPQSMRATSLQSPSLQPTTSKQTLKTPPTSLLLLMMLIISKQLIRSN